MAIESYEIGLPGCYEHAFETWLVENTGHWTRPVDGSNVVVIDRLTGDLISNGSEIVELLYLSYLGDH